MGKGLRSAAQFYGIPALATAAALAATLVFRDFLTPTIYLLFFAAVALAAWCGGLRAGLLATGLSLAAILFFLTPPELTWSIGLADDLLRLALFTAIAGTISVLSDLRLQEAQARQQLDTERRFRALVEAAPDAIVVLDRAERIVLVNSQAERLYGYPRREMVSQSVDLLVPERLREVRRAQRAQLFAGLPAEAQAARPEIYGLRRDGSEFPAEISFSPLETPEGVLLIAAVRDATEQRRTQEQLLRQQRQLAEAQQIARLGHWEWEVAANRVTWSGELLDIYGLAPGEFDGTYEGFLRRVHPDDRGWVDGIIRRAFEEGGSFQFEHRIVRPDGAVRVVHARGEAVRDGAGRTVRMVGTGQDITERKLAEEEHERLAREQAARAAAEEHQRRLLFLTDASIMLASSLDYEQTLQGIAELTVPVLADWCVVHVLDGDGSIRAVGVAHRDPEMVAYVRSLQQRYPIDLTRPAGVAQAIREGVTQFYPEVPPEAVAAQGYDPEYVTIIQRLGLRSAIIVPLTARGRTLGAISLLRAESGRHYTQDDLLLAETLARRAALAVDNALLYQAEQQARRAAEAAEAQVQQHAAALQALADASHEFSAAVPDLQTLLDSIARRVSAVTGDLCTLRLLSEDGQRLLPAAVWYRDPELVQATRELMEATQDAGSGLWRELLRTGDIVVYGARSTLPSAVAPEQAAFIQRYRPQATLIAPLHARGRLLGALSVVRYDRRGQFSETEIALVRDLVERAALAIDNARLYRQAEDQRHRLYTTLEQVPLGITLVEAPDGRISFRNSAAQQFSEWLSGARQTDTMTESYQAARYLAPDGTPIPLDEMPAAQVLRTGQPVHGREIICERDGERLTILTSVVPIEDAEGKVAAAVIVFQDITERKTLEQQKDEFLSLAAHELKTPLTVVKGNSQLLQRLLARGTASPAQMAQYLERIEQRIRYMEALINELLDLSRIVTGRLEFHPEPMDLAELVRNTVAQQEDIHPQTPYLIEGAGQPLVGKWDRGRIEQVLTNLLDNAAKYSAPGNPVTVTLAAGAQDVEIAVSDRGIGIPAADLPHIFERHYRARNVDRGHAGLGLGLYLSSEIVQRHGGRLWAESAVGRGSTFHITLPLTPGGEEG